MLSPWATSASSREEKLGLQKSPTLSGKDHSNKLCKKIGSPENGLIVRPSLFRNKTENVVSSVLLTMNLIKLSFKEQLQFMQVTSSSSAG